MRLILASLLAICSACAASPNDPNEVGDGETGDGDGDGEPGDGDGDGEPGDGDGDGEDEQGDGDGESGDGDGDGEAGDGDGDGEPGDGDGDSCAGDGDPGDGDGDPPPCLETDPQAPRPICCYPRQCSVTLELTDEGSVVEGDLNCAIDAFIDRGSASIRLTYIIFVDIYFTDRQVIYPVTDEIAIAYTTKEHDLSYSHEIARGKIMHPVEYFEGCKTAGDDVAIFWCLWEWGSGCGDTTLTCER